MTERIHPELMTCEDVVGTGRYPYTGRMGLLTAEDRGKVRGGHGAGPCVGSCFPGFFADKRRAEAAHSSGPAICQDPSVIVLDEPTSFLDIRHKLELLTILKDLVRRKKVAVLMSLHELDLAQKLSDYIVCVKGNTLSGAELRKRFSPPPILPGCTELPKAAIMRSLDAWRWNR